MNELVANGAILLNNLSVWVAFSVTLMIFSALAGDNPVSRLAQHILIGAGLGYAGILAVRHVLAPRLIVPVAAGEASLAASWIPFILAVILFIAGFDRTILQTIAGDTPIRFWRRGLHGAGRLVVALMLGIGLGAGVMGALQGTLIPQYLHAAQSAFTAGDAAPNPFTGVLTLLLTTATIMHLFIRPERHLRNQPSYAKGIVTSWIWIGQRALWFASGVIFARLIASRLSLLISRVDFLTDVLQSTALWSWFTSLR